MPDLDPRWSDGSGIGPEPSNIWLKVLFFLVGVGCGTIAGPALLLIWFCNLLASAPLWLTVPLGVIVFVSGTTWLVVNCQAYVRSFVTGAVVGLCLLGLAIGTCFVVFATGGARI
jgi:hypothetical protein